MTSPYLTPCSANRRLNDANELPSTYSILHTAMTNFRLLAAPSLNEASGRFTPLNSLRFESDFRGEISFFLLI